MEEQLYLVDRGFQVSIFLAYHKQKNTVQWFLM